MPPRRGLALALAAVFVVTMGYGVVLPVLPFLLARAFGASASQAIAWHTGLLTGVYMLMVFLFAPIWGRAADRVGRRTVILLGLAGFSGATLAFTFSTGLVVAYGARAFAGVFAAAVVPAVFAWACDGRTPDARARAFAWLYAANALGFLFGPALSAWLVPAETVTVAGAADIRWVRPFYAVAALSGAVWFVAYRWLADFEARPATTRAPQRDAQGLVVLLALSLLVMLGLGSFEVALALQGRQALNLGPREIGLLFAECSLVMILVQVFVIELLIKRTGGGALLAPALLVMAAGLALVPLSANYTVLILPVALIAGASGLLIPVLAYLVSLAAGAEQGAAFGMKTAVASLGQGVGSASAGWLFALFPQAPFWVIAGLLGLVAVVERGVSAVRKEAPHGG